MNDESTSEERTVHDEKPSGGASGAGKLESMSKEELIKLVKNQILLKKKLETKITELSNANTSLCQSEEQIRNQIDDDQSKYAALLHEGDQRKIQQSKLQQELDITRESLECFRSQNEALKLSCQTLQEEISNLRSALSNESQKVTENQLSHSRLLSQFVSTTNDLLQLPMSLSESIDDDGFLARYKNELEQKQDQMKQAFEQLEREKVILQQRVEDLEFYNEEIKLEVDDLRTKSFKYEQDKRAMEKEMDNYRRQVEDFEEQFLELQRESKHQPVTYDKSQSISSSMLTLHQSTEHIDEVVLQCVDTLLGHVEDQDQHMSKASSTSSLLLSSDIPTLLHSVGITNCTDEDFSIPLNFESVLRLSTLLIERCRVLQYILLKNNDMPINALSEQTYERDSVALLQTDGYEQCQIAIQRQGHLGLDTLFERIYTWMNQSISTNDWHMVLSKPLDQDASAYIRLELDQFKFVSGQVEDDLIETRTELKRLSDEHQQQREEIAALEKRLQPNTAYEQLKQRQSQLEEQLVEQCEKTIRLENLLQEENIDRLKLNQLEQIQCSYEDLQEKYRIAEQLEGQLRQLETSLTLKDQELREKQQLVEKFQQDYQHEHFHLLEREENIRLLKLELEQHEQSKETQHDKLDQIKEEFERQKLLLLDATRHQDERYSSLLNQQDELKSIIELNNNEKKNLTAKNEQLEKDLDDSRRSSREKTREINDLQLQLESFQVESDGWKMKHEQLKEEKAKCVDEITLLINQITHLEKEKIESNKTIEQLKEELNARVVEVSVQASPPAEDQTVLVAQLREELTAAQQDNDQLRQATDELNEKLESRSSDSKENVHDMKEKYQKMKVLLTRLKKELQEKTQQPKQSLLDLELADYEKTIKNHKEDLQNKDKEIQELRDELSNSTEKYAFLKMEMDNLEQQKDQTDERANKFKTLLDTMKKELQTAKDLEQERHSSDDNARVLLDKFQIDLDSNKVLISELVQDKQQLLEKIDHQSETNQKTILLLEQNLRIAKHELEIAKQDNETLQDDFNSYKIRAQSVLKQQQSTQRERTPSVVDKQVELEETIERLKGTLREANNKMQLLISENEILQKEQDRLVEAQAKLIHESRKREQDLRKQHQSEIDKIESDHLQRTNESHEMMKNITLQNETLSIAFKEQIAAIESDHERSIVFVQNQLQTARQEIEQLKARLETVRQNNLESEKISFPSPDSASIGINNHSNRDDILAWSASERQQGEGSESINADLNPTDIAVKTLENVLFGAGHSDTSGAATSPNLSSPSATNEEKPRHVLFEDVELERQRIEEELNKTRLRLLNTTELLNESELNNVRLSEQVSLLKDEIRRIERNMERAESISNLEYLKNVIVKFFVLRSTPERLQLIPVLVTMLKLSPEEQAQLVRVANSNVSIDEQLRTPETASQPMTNGANSTAPSWSAYLNIW